VTMPSSPKHPAAAVSCAGSFTVCSSPFTFTNSTSATVLNRPRLNRMLECASSSPTPMCRST